MGTTRTFNTMLNEHLNYDLLKEEITKRTYILETFEHDDDWKGGTLPVPFKAAQSSSIAFGSLSGSTDISEQSFVRGQITTQPELWGSMVFNHRDFIEHDGKVNESSFLKLLPEIVEDFLDWMKNAVSFTMCNAAYFASLTADGDSSGNITVDRPERFEIGQKIIVLDGNTSAITSYVNAINLNTGVVNGVTARGGATPTNFSAITVGQTGVVYYDGGNSVSFTSLRSSLLSAANGGSSTLYGQTKASYPYLQAINVDGSTVTAVNVVEKIFDAYTTVRKLGKGNPTECWVSWKHFGSILKVLEAYKGAFNVMPGSQKVSVYGWSKITVMGVAGPLDIVSLHEMPDTDIFFIDKSAAKIHSNGYFRKRVGPDGLSYFVVRNTTGYQYIQDVCFFGDLVLSRPNRCGILYGISY